MFRIFKTAAIVLSLFFMAAQTARADKVVIRGGHHRVVVVKHRHPHWRHSHWHHVVLAPEFVTYLGPYPEYRPGYHRVTVYFADGEVYREAYVYDRDRIELPPSYDGRVITRIEIVK